MAAGVYDVILPLLATSCVVTSRSADFDNGGGGGGGGDVQYELIERFLTVRNLDVAVFYNCWSISDRMKNMKKLNEKKIMVSYRDKRDFDESLNLKDAFSIPLYSPTMGVIVDWSCNEDLVFQFTEHWIWNEAYQWLMIMENDPDENVDKFLASKNINLTIWSEVWLAYPYETEGIVIGWHIYDIYRTGFEPRGELVVDVLNETFGKWGNRNWKYDKRSNLRNLTLNAAFVGFPVSIGKSVNGSNAPPTREELVTYLETFTLDRVRSVQKYSFGITNPLTKDILNISIQFILTNSWGFKVNNKWDGMIGSLISGEADLSMTLNALKPNRFEVIDYYGVTPWRHLPCIIFRHPRTSAMSVNIFLRPFEPNVWFTLIGLMLLYAVVYLVVVRYEVNQKLSITFFSEIFLLKVGTLCQQGTTMEPTKFTNRYIVLLLFLFSLMVFQFYSSSIVSGLLRAIVMNIDTVQKLEESGMDFGVEDLNYVIQMTEANSKVDPYLKKLLDEKVRPRSEYITAMEGVKKLKKGHYAFFTDPATTYWTLNEIFTEREKCDLTELTMNTPEVTAFSVQKRSPYRKVLIYAGRILFETGLMSREVQIWYAMKPECTAGKTVTEESLVSVGIKDVKSLLIFMFVSCIVCFIILLLEIIVYHSNTDNDNVKSR